MAQDWTPTKGSRQMPIGLFHLVNLPLKYADRHKRTLRTAS